jgi:hypothetical protein
MNKFMAWVGLILLSVAAFFLRLHVLTILWGYIMVPIGAPKIGWLTAFGLTLMIALVTTDYKPEEEKYKTLESLAQRTISSILGSILTAGVAYLIFT